MTIFTSNNYFICYHHQQRILYSWYSFGYLPRVHIASRPLWYLDRPNLFPHLLFYHCFMDMPSHGLGQGGGEGDREAGKSEEGFGRQGTSTGLNERAAGEVAFTSKVAIIYIVILFLQIWTDAWLLECRWVMGRYCRNTSIGRDTSGEWCWPVVLTNLSYIYELPKLPYWTGVLVWHYSCSFLWPIYILGVCKAWILMGSSRVSRLNTFFYEMRFSLLSRKLGLGINVV